jgi:hypothetical protein
MGEGRYAAVTNLSNYALNVNLNVKLDLNGKYNKCQGLC